MQRFSVIGMTCAACSARVEKAVLGVDGVKKCAVSLLTNSMGVEGTASEAAIIEAVEGAGYGATAKASEKMQDPIRDTMHILTDHETPQLARRLLMSCVLLVPLLYVSMGHMLWHWPIFAFFEDNYVALGILQMLLALLIMVINKQFFVSGTKSLFNRAPNMDALVALGSGASFVWSTIVLLAMTKSVVDQESAEALAYFHDLYFESAAMIVTLITVGKMLEARSKGKTTDALKSLLILAPQRAVVVRDGQEMTVDIKNVVKGDIFLVRPGENVPVDGVILEGATSINEACLTGESIPCDKEVGDLVVAGTQNQTGFVRCRAERIGEDTTLAQIIQLVSDAAATKAPVSKIADRVSGIFVPLIIGLAVLTTIVWLAVGSEVGFALARGIAVLVISCPCALGLATPVAIMVGSGQGARCGIFFKTAAALEQVGKLAIVAMDKTGTITKGEPKVTDVLPSSGVKREEFLALAYGLEAKSEHPLARAIVQYGLEQKIIPQEITDFQSVTGSGVQGKSGG
ncbi:MAG: heavy metal translocating P-type ATPase, partial [Desulfovibrio sp.]|nr:heavy metal translocating P-type ATPase [Desulfovibrio sp.]